MKRREEASEQSEIQQIGFGDVFLYELVKGRRDGLGKAVMHTTNTDRSFEALVVLEDSPTEALHPWGGTMLLRDVLQIIDHWDFERVIRALQEGAKRTGLTVIPERIEKLRIESQKQPIHV